MGLSMRAKRLIRAQVRTKREPERTMMAKSSGFFTRPLAWGQAFVLGF